MLNCVGLDKEQSDACLDLLYFCPEFIIYELIRLDCFIFLFCLVLFISQ